MKTSIVYPEELLVTPVDVLLTNNPKTSSVTLCIDVPQAHVKDFLEFGLEVITSSRPNPEKIYAPKGWEDSKGTNLKRLLNLSSPDLEYLRVCYKCVETYKLFIDSGISEDIASILLPSFSLVRCSFHGPLLMWKTLYTKWMQSKNPLHSVYASKIITLVSK